jgi:Protein of unknown function (DUF4238)
VSLWLRGTRVGPNSGPYRYDAKLSYMGKLQHFVGRFYLRAWAADEKVYCLQAKEIRRPNIKNVAAENYFYRLQELSIEDIEFLRVLFSDSPEGLTASHEQLFQAFTLPHLVKRQLERAGLAASEHMAQINEMIIEVNEKLHTSIEEDFQPCLAEMRAGSLDFLQNIEDAMKFYRGLAVQYVRTNHINRTRLIMDAERLALYKRVVNPMVHIMAINAGFTLFVEREKHTIMLLDNSTEVPFITADQPVINVSASPKQTTPPARFDLYYPVSPTRAMMLVGPAGDLLPNNSSVSKQFVEMCNLRMAAHSYRQVFSSSPDALTEIKDTLPAYMSCFPG